MSGDWRRALAGLGIVAVAAGCGSEDQSLGPDRHPPAVVTLEPATGATAVPLESVIRATFSEAVVLDSLAPPPLRVEGPSGPISGAASLDVTGTIMTFHPQEGLSPATDYRLVLAAGISDLAGNMREDSLASHFTTALEFYSVGRIFVASLNSRDVRVFDAQTYAAIPGSPVVLGLRPIRLRVVPETEEVYVLYLISPSAGLLVLDARTLSVRGDSGGILPEDVSDVAVSAADRLAFVSSPGSDAVHVLDTAALRESVDPIVFARTGSAPIRVSVAKGRRMLLVGLEGASQLAAFGLPGLAPAAGFPVPAVRLQHTITIDEQRNRAWVGGGQRYAVVDLLNPARSVTFQIPNLPSCLPPSCTPRIWSMVLSQADDRAYFLNRRDLIASTRISDLSVVDENWGTVIGIQSDLIQNPRSGALVIVESRSVGAALIQVDPLTLSEVDAPRIPDAGDGPLDMAVLP